MSRVDILNRTIDEQNQKLEKYQAKLRDVVSAYKELQKEKTALEESLKALSLSQPEDIVSESPASSRTRRRQGEASGNEIEGDDKSSAISSEDQAGDNSEEGKNEDDEEDKWAEEPVDHTSDSLHRRLATLMSSLSTVTEQKSKMEATYLAEKKRLKQDMDDAEKRFHQERDNLQNRIQQLESENEQWRNKVRSQQYEREKELSDHALVIKELQKVISDERMAREQLENQLEDSRLLLNDKQRMQSNQAELYEKTIRDLRQELDACASQLKASKVKVDEPSPLLLHLQKELLDVKDEERRAVMAAQQRADSAEMMYQQLAKQSEARVSSLEAKLSELSETVGSVERLRQQDQAMIQKLRERVVQLDAENTTLTGVAQTIHSPPANTSSTDESELDTSMLLDKMLHFKELLKTANEKSEKPINLCDVLLSSEERSEVHRKCIEQYDHLRDEFERYKLRAQSVLKNKSSSQTKESGPEREIAALKSQVAELRDRVAVLRAANDDHEAKLREKEDGFARTMAAVRDSHRAELSERDSLHRQRTAELETEMRRHRDRTVSMLAERDREIASLRTQAIERLPLASLGHYKPDDIPAASESSEVGASCAETPGGIAVSELIANVGVGCDDAKILHFAHERSRYEAEAANLRRQKYALETALRDARRDAALAAELHADELSQLREEVAKRDRGRSRETANLEYLKNVVHRYMMCRGGVSARQQMLNAIATILQFSPAEKQQVQTVLAKGWWTSRV